MIRILPQHKVLLKIKLFLNHQHVPLRCWLQVGDIPVMDSNKNRIPDSVAICIAPPGMHRQPQALKLYLYDSIN